MLNINDVVSNFGLLNVANLPIARYRSNIIETVRNNKVTIIYGDTGSGKTTQIPQYILDAALNNDRTIAVTQPRRIAAISMARRVAQEMGCALGIEVGYEVRFESRFRGCTKIKYMTDGILLNHCLNDRNLKEYGVIMIDEAHERSIQSDVLLGLLKKIISERDDLKVLITSATIKTEKFSAYFNDAPIIKFEGRLFPVELNYQSGYSYINDSVNIISKIHDGKEDGDILVFLTGQEEIDMCCNYLKGIENLVVLPLHGSLDSDTQQKVFKKVSDGQRKVVVATNIAETTITIEGIKFVVDCGYVKQNTFNAKLGMDVLEETRISKAQADQRKGRAGRTSSGVCYRLYNQTTYDRMSDEAIPDILRKNLCEIYLKIIAIGYDPMRFDFIDPPDKKNLKLSEKELQDLFLLDQNKCLTEMGRNMNDLPVAPILGMVLLSSYNFYCTKDIVTILSMMTENNIFKRSKNNYSQTIIHQSFHDAYGDHLTRLNVFNSFLTNGKTKKWCFDNFLNFDTLTRVDLAREQLLAIMRNKNIPLDSVAPGDSKNPIRKAIIKGYYRNICRQIAKGKYLRYLDREVLFIHPGSCLFNESPEL